MSNRQSNKDSHLPQEKTRKISYKPKTKKNITAADTVEPVVLESIIDTLEIVEAFEPYTSEWALENGPGTFFYSKKVDSLINTRKDKKGEIHGEPGLGYNALNLIQVQHLTAKELVYYSLAYPSAFSQNCSAFSLPVSERKYFYHYLPATEDAHFPGEIQTAVMLEKRNEIVDLLKRFFERTDHIETPLLELTKNLNAIEVVPVLCKKADFKQNRFIYTILIDLMDTNEFLPFTNSRLNAMIKKGSTDFFNAYEASDKEADQLVSFAMRFYRSKLPKNGQP